MFDTLQPHGLKPTRLLCLWDFPGKNIGMPFSSSGDHPDLGIEPTSLALLVDSLPLSHLRSLSIGSCSISILPFRLSGWPAATAAKSLQSCLTLCDPMDCSPPGSPVPGILQARTLEWVAISFSNPWKWKVRVKSLSHVRLLATPWTAAYQALPSMGFSRQEYRSGVPLPSPEPKTGSWEFHEGLCSQMSPYCFSAPINVLEKITWTCLQKCYKSRSITI